MDVTCERCGTEYEFDETLLSGRGTSVKCTNCGHVFKVYPTAHEDVDRSTSTWRLMRRDGSVGTIESLRELQQRIGSGDLRPSDQISRGGEDFKPLGSIPELETFFQAAGVEQPKIPSPVPPAPAASTSDSSLPPGRRPRQPTLLGVVPVPRPVRVGDAPERTTATGLGGEVGNQNVTAPVDSVDLADTRDQATAPDDSESGSMRLPEAEDESTTMTSPITDSLSLPDSSAFPSKSVIEDAEFEEPVGSSRRSVPPPGYYDDDEDIPELPGRGWSPTRWLVLVVAIGMLMLVGTQWQRITGMLGFGAAPEASSSAIDEGDLALAEDHLEAYQRAIASYDRALQAGDEDDLGLLIKLARANALAAQALDDDERVSDTESSREAHAKAALNYAEQALMVDAESLDARLAETDALRLRGDIKRARESLERARLMPFSRTAEFFRVEALLQSAEHGGKLETGLLSATHAAEIGVEGVRYRLLLARAQLAAGDRIRARTAVEAVLATAPGHPTAVTLLEQLEEVPTVPDAGVAADAGVTADAGPAPAVVIPTDGGPAVETEIETGEATAKVDAADSRNATEKPAPTAPSKKRSSRSRERPEYDEYDRLAQAAGSDAFVDGRPPLRDFGWYMREGEAALAGGDYTKARAFFESALESRPGSGDATDALGRTAFRSGDAELSLRYFRSAAQRGHPDGYYNLGAAYEKLGRTDEAVSAYYTYLKRRPSGVHVAAARAAIKGLDPRVRLPESDSEADSEDAEAPEPTPAPESEPEAQSEPTQESEATTP